MVGGIGWKLVRTSLVAALAGFLFGYDTIVISGAEQEIQELWALTGPEHGLCMSAALWGTVFGSLVGGWPTQQYGRRVTLLWVGLLYIVSSLGSACADGPRCFSIMRFLGGIGVGVATIASPIYISEISPAHSRGRLTGLFQFNIVFGIIASFTFNYIIAQHAPADLAWRAMLAAMALPSALYTYLCFFIPESPRWLISLGKQQEAINELVVLEPQLNEHEASDRIRTLEVALHVEQSEISTSLCQQMVRLRNPITLAVLLAMFNQLSGINAVLYFAPRIFEWAGMGRDAALLQGVGIGLANMIFTALGIYLIDTLGRRTLLIIGCVGYVFSLGGCSWAFSAQQFHLVPACVFAFVGAHAVGQGAVIWVFISEIFPSNARTIGQTLGCGTLWCCAAVLTLVFPGLAEVYAPETIFGFFCATMMVHLIWVIVCIPETKGVPLEDVEVALGIAPARVGLDVEQYGHDDSNKLQDSDKLFLISKGISDVRRQCSAYGAVCNKGALP